MCAEYGATLDPVTQLVVGMERRRVQALQQAVPHPSAHEMMESSEYDDHNDKNNDNTVGSVQVVVPKVLLMLDQFGVCHAPYAQARSLLTEHHYGEVLCIVHDTFGQVATHEASSLVPAPSGDFPLTHDDFLKIQED